MEVDGGEFISSPIFKTVRFGGTVTNILDKFLQGDTNDYELLKHQLLDPDIKDAQIIRWLQEFRSCVTHLTKDFEQLVSVILRLPWLGRSQDVVEEYLAFLSNLVSAQTVYLRSCLSVTVSHFIPGRIVIKEGDVDISDSDDDDENLPRNFDLCHRALEIIARYVPSTSRFLMPILREKFPFINKSARTLECYMHNLLRITVAFPALRQEILELVIGKLLRLDVSLVMGGGGDWVSAPRSDIEDAEENAAQGADGNGQEEGLFDMDEDEENVTNSSRPPGVDVMAHASADRLDILMMVLLAYIKDLSYVKGTLELTLTKELYRDLIAVFDKLILPTHASCHVQYAIFYLCSFRLGLAEAFLEHLWKKMQSPSNPAVIRQTAAGYIGSFLARAKFLPLPTVKACLDLLVPWLHQYIDSQDAGSKAFCDVTLHGPFYATCQAVFYTLVFRHRQMVEGNLRKGLAYLQMLNFERIVMCQLNPLKVCLPAVTNMFAAITRKYQLVFCYTIIERNNRQMLSVVRSSLGGDSLTANANPLDSFFPFDPYLLKRSGKIIQPIYQVWEEVSMCDGDEAKRPAKKDSVTEEEDDFLRGESLQSEAVVGLTPGSYESHMRSPSSMGSSPIAFLQRPF
ncbi:RNA polymerase I-specific transcription initiation factor RRN3 [Acipenser ruthenus]|uniref:RNA polymerase I-specific transcription initiation factor RRN3 n=1 Tax=Acipenser ruthenus TaxID=7906 RepID=A0A662Z168_ACIRT|nr:RNA polymerase I-specific transcription initiation factor RRN3 [Acipenser ruthenus]